jgi:tetratricopeptide (TPR) repeat protein
MADARGEVTELLVELKLGRKDALDRLMPLVYRKLRRIAGNQMRHEPLTMGPAGEFSARLCVVLLLLVCCFTVAAQEAAELPLALILTGSGAKILRAGSELPLTAKPGDILFSGDALRSEGGSVTFLACSGNTQQTLSPDGEALFEPHGPKLRAGRFTDQKPAGCFLPALPRFVIASQQHADAAVAQELSRAAGPQTFEERLRQLPDELRTQATSELSALDKTANPNGAVNHLARAQVFEKYGLKADAADEMRKVVAVWPDAGWARSRLFVLVEEAAKSRGVSLPPSGAEGQTYALLVGISSFKDERINPLNFAHLDAIELANLLKSPRAGAIPDDNIVVLTNQAATRSAIQNAIEAHLKGHAGKNDTVLLFIASHGASFPVGNTNKGFIVTYDSNPEELATSGIPMDDIRQLFSGQLGNVKRLLLYVDVCHAGHIGQIEPDAKNTNKAASALDPADVDVFGMLAAQKSQVAIEGFNYGGGHGAFTYFLMRGLNGAADLNGDGKVTMDELADYVKDKVQESTASQQIPKTIGDIDQTRVMARVDKPGIELKDYTRVVLTASRSINPPAALTLAAIPALPSTASRLKYQDAATLVDQFEKAVAEGRILNTEEQGAFTFLAALKARLKSDDYQREAEKLRVALENRGQEVLLAYLAGDRVPQQRADFLLGEAYFEAALLLAPDSLYLQSRLTFCQGRAAIFDKDYAGAAALLERAIGLDGERGYAYNGLGIAYLERANYDLAIAAFRDAARRAPYWAYPLHNMALAYTEKGDYDNAIRVYQRAMRLAPRVAYLPYNLGLLYQRMNRPADAEAMYRRALGTEPGNAQALNALGSLKAAAGRRVEAEQFYEQALERDPALLAARHNLAVLLAADAKRSGEALALWRDNLARDPDYLPSRLSLARALAATGHNEEAAQEYEKVIAARPAYVAARLALADVDIRIGKPNGAVSQLQQALQLQPGAPEILEQAARAYASLGRTAEARSAYERALQLAPDGAARKRIRAALEKLGSGNR